jgi:hypothetical protein
MKSFKQFLKEEINKEERQAQNIVGAKQKQMKDEECERPVKKISDEDAEDMNSTPSATPTGEVSAELSATGVSIDQEKKDEPSGDVVAQQVLDILNQRGNELDQESQQEYLVRKQRFDELMKQINDVIAQNKVK